MRRAERLLRIIQILRRHRRPVKGQNMAEEVEVSLRTLYRDIADLISDGVPIRGEAGIGYILGEGYDVPPLMFNADELEAIMLGLRWVERRGDSDLSRAAQDTIAKIGAVLPQQLKPFLFDSGLLAPPVFHKTVDAVDVAALRQAVEAEFPQHHAGVKADAQRESACADGRPATDPAKAEERRETTEDEQRARKILEAIWQ